MWCRSFFALFLYSHCASSVNVVLGVPVRRRRELGRWKKAWYKLSLEIPASQPKRDVSVFFQQPPLFFAHTYAYKSWRHLSSVYCFNWVFVVPNPNNSLSLPFEESCGSLSNYQTYHSHSCFQSNQPSSLHHQQRRRRRNLESKTKGLPTYLTYANYNEETEIT